MSIKPHVVIVNTTGYNRIGLLEALLLLIGASALEDASKTYADSLPSTEDIPYIAKLFAEVNFKMYNTLVRNNLRFNYLKFNKNYFVTF